MGKGWKVVLSLGAVAGAVAAILAIKKRKDAEEYDYEEFDDDCDCEFDACDCTADDHSDEEECLKKAAAVDAAESANEEAAEDVEVTLDNLNDEVDEIDQ